jgi:hypothetical protein
MGGSMKEDAAHNTSRSAFPNCCLTSAPPLTLPPNFLLPLAAHADTGNGKHYDDAAG